MALSLLNLGALGTMTSRLEDIPHNSNEQI
jgi:hypothetical protein